MIPILCGNYYVLNGQKSISEKNHDYIDIWKNNNNLNKYMKNSYVWLSKACQKKYPLYLLLVVVHSQKNMENMTFHL